MKASSRPRVLVAGTDLNGHGGVAAYFSSLLPHMSGHVDYLAMGSRPGERPWRMVPRLILDYARYWRHLSLGSYDLIHINPTFAHKSLPRDALLILCARLHGTPIILMMHGWSEWFERLLSRFGGGTIAKILDSATIILVLDNAWTQALRRLGCNTRIDRFSTAFDEHIIGFCGDRRSRLEQTDAGARILFLGRVERQKGIFELLRAIRLLRERGIPVSLSIAGDGSDMAAARAQVKKWRLEGVSFLGHVKGQDKLAQLRDADIFVLSSHSEGMPVAVLEAMAAGLPVVVRSVGGLRDFFQHGRMGLWTESSIPEELANLVAELINDPEAMTSMGAYNRIYAQKHFAAPVVARELEDIYRRVLERAEPARVGGVV